jgi:hypothetical protein
MKMRYNEAIQREETKKALEGTNFQLGSKWNGKVYADSIYVDSEKQTLANKPAFESLVAEINSIEWALLNQTTATFIMKAYMVEHIQRSEYTVNDMTLTVFELPANTWGFEAARYGVARKGDQERFANDAIIEQFIAKANS